MYPMDNLGVVSVGFLLPNPDDAVIWRGPKKNGMIKQFLKDVYWGDELDFLVPLPTLPSLPCACACFRRCACP